MDPVAIVNLIALVIQVFGPAATKIVADIHAESGMTDEQLLEAAETKDQETRDMIAKHMVALKAGSATAQPAIATTEDEELAASEMVSEGGPVPQADGHSTEVKGEPVTSGVQQPGSGE